MGAAHGEHGRLGDGERVVEAPHEARYLLLQLAFQLVLGADEAVQELKGSSLKDICVIVGLFLLNELFFLLLKETENGVNNFFLILTFNRR